MIKSEITGVVSAGALCLAIFSSSGCSKSEAKTSAPPPFPVNTQTVSLTAVPQWTNMWQQ
jgi:hypothetical protein